MNVLLFKFSGPEWHLKDLSIIRPLQRIMSFITKAMECKFRIGT